MCGRATCNLTWEEIIALYQLTLFQPAVNTRARFNVCPTTTILIPSWWSKPLKEMKRIQMESQ
jgi:putative SOS response-associated peptidase YedK